MEDLGFLLKHTKREYNRIFNPTLTKNMPNVKWKEIPPVRGPNPKGKK